MANRVTYYKQMGLEVFLNLIALINANICILYTWMRSFYYATLGDNIKLAFRLK